MINGILAHDMIKRSFTTYPLSVCSVNCQVGDTEDIKLCFISFIDSFISHGISDINI